MRKVQPSTNGKGSWIAGRSLPQEYYTSPDIFAQDVRLIGDTQWQLVDHESRIKNPGDYFTFEFANESIIVVRNEKGAINAFYNVCRHRGSRICLEHSGSTKLLRCPYHSWTYDLNGALRPAQFMPEDFDRASNGLIPCHVRVFEGMIFLNFAEGEPPDFESCVGDMRPYLAPHGIGQAKIAAQNVYPTAANWKLCIENFLECYHCRSAHKAYCSVHDGQKMLAFGAGAGSSGGDIAAKYEVRLKAWEERTRAMGHFTGMFADGADSPYFRSAGRLPISDTAVTETLDGKPIARLMGSFREYDGGQTGLNFNAISTVLANNDHVVLFRFTPRGPLSTDVVTTWLVAPDAIEGKDYSVKRLTELWDVTLDEDKTITENNQLGVLSRSYRPGVYSQQEQRIADFGAWYMTHMQVFAPSRAALHASTTAGAAAAH
jgi:Rieske 2Fe-2S family protein